jgi:hypothetical protein
VDFRPAYVGNGQPEHSTNTGMLKNATAENRRLSERRAVLLAKVASTGPPQSGLPMVPACRASLLR